MSALAEQQGIISMTTVSNGSDSGQRVEGYDIARSLAFLGMILVNFWAVMDADVPCPPWLTSLLDMIQGRAAAAFVMLAGVGLSLLSKGVYESHDPAFIRANRFRIWRRAAFLFALGVLNAIIWPVDILHFYALYFVAGAVLVSFSNQRLLALTATPVFAFALMMVLLDFDQGEDWGSLAPGEWLNPLRVLRHLFFNGHYPFFPWISFLIVGLWLGRQDLNNVRLRRKIALAGFSGALISEFLSWIVFYLAESPHIPWNLESMLPWFAIDPWEPMPLFMISASGTALIAIISLVVWTAHFRGARWLRPFVAAGQTTLTLYMVHILVAEAGLKTMKWWHLNFSLYPIVGGGLFFLLSLLACDLWKKRYPKGPLEWVMRGWFDRPMFKRTRIA